MLSNIDEAFKTFKKLYSLFYDIRRRYGLSARPWWKKIRDPLKMTKYVFSSNNDYLAQNVAQIKGGNEYDGDPLGTGAFEYFMVHPRVYGWWKFYGVFRFLPCSGGLSNLSKWRRIIESYLNSDSFRENLRNILKFCESELKKNWRNVYYIDRLLEELA